MSSDIAIIGGTGLEFLIGVAESQAHSVETVFGRVPLISAHLANVPIWFISRHGADHGIAPHDIHYQRNIEALRVIGVRQVFASNAVGSLSRELVPGTLLLPDDFIDFTHHRQLSFWDGHPDRPSGVTHTDFSAPYCPRLRERLIVAASRRGVQLVPKGTYLCAEGPRFESPAEIRMFRQLGGDVVGMTGLPEAVFAREAGLCYAALNIVTNLGAGLSNELVDHSQVVEVMSQSIAQALQLIISAVNDEGSTLECRCRTSG